MDEASARQRLLRRREELDEEDRISAVDRAPVTLDQDSVGRLSRIDAMQMQAMALATERRLVGLGAVLAPTVSECVLPAEVAAASPAGMLTMIGYGPEVNFAEKPKAPIWTAKVRFKTSASLIRGMGGIGGYGGAAAQPGQPGQPGQPPKKRKRFGIGDILNGTIPGN